MGRRGLLATLMHQARVAERERQRAERAAVREHNASLRRAEKAQRALEKAQAAFARASEAERKRLEKEAKEAYIAAKEAEAEEQNLRLAEIDSDLESLLDATLKVDDYFDLEVLRAVAVHPPFESKYESPVPVPDPVPDPPKPVLVEPDAPKGLFASLFGQKKHAAAVARSHAKYEEALAKWRSDIERVRVHRQSTAEAHARAEKHRLALLKKARETYAQECAAREAEVAASNKSLDALIANLGYGTPEAVQEYVSIVLSNSVYPAHFAVTHDFEFEASTAELRLHVVVPGPTTIPETKSFKYTKSSDEITSTALSQKTCRDRYASIVSQVALRSLHEVFEADRRSLIRTIRLEVGTDTIDPATGRRAYIPFVVVGAERDAFLEFDLSAVVPDRTLARMGAAVSKNPYALVAAETEGVRRS